MNLLMMFTIPYMKLINVTNYDRVDNLLKKMLLKWLINTLII